jgi:hypothetical protein
MSRQVELEGMLGEAKDCSKLSTRQRPSGLRGASFDLSSGWIDEGKAE